MGTHHMTISQQVWLAAWTAAIQSGKYNPKDEADLCLKAFNEKFIPRPVIDPPPKVPVEIEEKLIEKLSEVMDEIRDSDK